MLPKLEAWRFRLDAFRDKRKSELIAALILLKGNIKKSAQKIGISRQRATVLIRELQLSEFAKELRYKAGGAKSGFGRPPNFTK